MVVGAVGVAAVTNLLDQPYWTTLLPFGVLALPGFWLVAKGLRQDFPIAIHSYARMVVIRTPMTFGTLGILLGTALLVGLTFLGEAAPKRVIAWVAFLVIAASGFVVARSWRRGCARCDLPLRSSLLDITRDQHKNMVHAVSSRDPVAVARILGLSTTFLFDVMSASGSPTRVEYCPQCLAVAVVEYGGELAWFVRGDAHTIIGHTQVRQSRP